MPKAQVLSRNLKADRLSRVCLKVGLECQSIKHELDVAHSNMIYAHTFLISVIVFGVLRNIFLAYRI